MGSYRIMTPTGWGTPGTTISAPEDLPEAEALRGVESGILVAVGSKERAVVKPKVERAVEDKPEPKSKPKGRRSKRG